LEIPPTDIPTDTLKIEDWVYRHVTVEGVFDSKYEIVLRNRAFNGRPGFHLITPLLLEDQENGVLIDRGWIPSDDGSIPAPDVFAVSGPVRVTGIIQLSQPEPSWSLFADPIPKSGHPPLKAWRVLNIAGIQGQIPYPLLPYFIQQSEPIPGISEMPIPEPDIDLSEGPHFSYAVQWFAFAAISIGGFGMWWRERTP
jgi:surfeit locus 1 family protein